MNLEKIIGIRAMRSKSVGFPCVETHFICKFQILKNTKTYRIMSKLRRYKKVDTSLSHLCTFAPVKDPAVVIGSYYCKNICPHCRGTLNILGVRYVRCDKP